jgi:transcriptional regulator with XRE-family HTH domain
MDSRTDITVGSSLRQIRKRQGLTQVQVAERLSVPQSYVSKVETGERRLLLSEAYSYADALGVRVDVLVYEVGTRLGHQARQY